MVALICAVINITIITLCFIKKESLFHPVCLLNLMWLAVNMLNIILGWNSSEVAYLILCIPPLFFSIGFFITEKTRILPAGAKFLIAKIKTRFPSVNTLFHKVVGLIRKGKAFLRIPHTGRSKPVGLKGMHSYASTGLLAFVSIVFVCYTCEFLTRLGQYNDGNIWYAFRLITWNHNINDLFVYKYSSVVAFLLPSVLLISAQKSRKRADLYKFIASLAIAIVWSIIRTSRTSTFNIVILLVMSQIVLMETSGSKKMTSREKAAMRKKTLFIFGVAVIFILAVFLYVALQKNGNLYGDVSVFEFFLKSIANYTNLSSAAFVEWYKQGVTYTYGSNSFRFLIAVLYKLGIVATPPAANSGGLFITYDGLSTNALTVARAYVEDFGVIYMAFMLMVFGMVHGAMHRKARVFGGLRKIRYALISGMLYIPLFFQILTNQYLNVLSAWIQHVLWICLFTWSVFWVASAPKKKELSSDAPAADSTDV